MRRAVIVVGYVIGAYFVIRAIIQLATLDYGDSASYRDDWGGPSLVGVLAVHCLPGVLALLAMIWLWLRFRHQRASARSTASENDVR